MVSNGKTMYSEFSTLIIDFKVYQDGNGSYAVLDVNSPVGKITWRTSFAEGDIEVATNAQLYNLVEAYGVNMQKRSSRPELCAAVLKLFKGEKIEASENNAVKEPTCRQLEKLLENTYGITSYILMSPRIVYLERVSTRLESNQFPPLPSPAACLA